MTDSRVRCLTVLTIAFGIAMLASNQAVAQTAFQPNKKMRIKAANEKKKADAAAKKANDQLAFGGQPIGNTKENEPPKTSAPSAKKPKKYRGYKPPWVLWREAHPEEASIEMQQAAEQMRENEKRLGRIGFTNPPPTDAQKERERQNRERAANRTGAN